MKNLSGISLIVFLTCSSAAAQQWSAEEQEVLSHVEECFSAFTEATKQNDFDIWVQRCRPREDSLYWTAPDAGPIGLEGLRRGWDIYFRNRISTSSGLEPVRIQLLDNVALIYGYSYWYRENGDGDVEYMHDKRLEVYRKEDGKWTLVSIVWSPVAVDD